MNACLKTAKSIEMRVCQSDVAVCGTLLRAMEDCAASRRQHA